jgi:hypothetical protein
MTDEIDWSKVGNTDPIAYLKSTIPDPQMPKGMDPPTWAEWSAMMDNARHIRDGEDVA